jgi:hypothetical protein
MPSNPISDQKYIRDHFKLFQRFPIVFWVVRSHTNRNFTLIWVAILCFIHDKISREIMAGRSVENEKPSKPIVRKDDNYACWIHRRSSPLWGHSIKAECGIRNADPAMCIDRELTRQRLQRLCHHWASFSSEKPSSQRTGDDENTFASMPVNSESVWKEIDESNLQLKNILSKKLKMTKHCN